MSIQLGDKQKNKVLVSTPMGGRGNIGETYKFNMTGNVLKQKQSINKDYLLIISVCKL